MKKAVKRNALLTSVFSVTGLLILSKLLGFVKQMMTAAAFGATLETDIINLSQGLIGNLEYLLVQSVLSALIAVYLHTSQQGEDMACRFAFDVWKALTVIAAAAVLLVELSAPWLACLIAPSYSAEYLASLSSYLRLFAPVLLLLVWTAVFNGLLHANKRFIPGEMISVHQSVLLIALTALLSRRLGVSVLVVAFFAHNIYNALYTAVLSRRYWAVSLGNPFRNPAVRQLLCMMLPLLAGYSLVYVNQMVDKALVSGLEIGAVTALNYASVLSNLVSTFITTFASMLFAYATEHIAMGDEAGAAQLTNRTTLLLLTGFFPVCLLTCLCAEDIVTIIYARGAFDAESVRICAMALRGYALMFVPLVVREVYSRYLYGHQDSKRPMVNSGIAAVCNIVLSIALCPFFGVLGVAVATSISVMVCAALDLHTAYQAHSVLRGSGVVHSLPWLLTGGAACLAAARIGLRAFSGMAPFPRFVFTALLGFAAYAVAASPLLLRLLRQLRQKEN